MQKYKPEQYKKIYEKLPKEIQGAISSSENAKKIWAIGKNHKLQIDQTGNLQDIVLDVMMGITAAKNFVKTIGDELKISGVDASAVARDIDEQIFKPIKEVMVKIYADGAPYKLSTMQTVDEKDESHENLDKDELLREIENPEANEKRTVNIENTPPPKEAEIMTGLKMSSSRVLEEYHEEIEPTEKPITKNDLRSSAPTGISSVEESKKRLLESIASKKLSGIFTMPTVEVEVGSLPKKIVVKEKIPVTPTSIEKNIVKKEAPAPASTPTSTDPYRESIK